jgi:hypothetical protein
VRLLLEPTVVIRALIVVTVDTLVPRRGQVGAPQVLAYRIVVVDGGVGEVGDVRHPHVGDPCVHVAQWDIHLAGGFVVSSLQCSLVRVVSDEPAICLVGGCESKPDIKIEKENVTNH